MYAKPSTSPELHRDGLDLRSMIDPELHRDGSDLRSMIESDPHAVLAGRGVPVPPGIDVRIVFNTARVFHVPLPPDPNAAVLDEDLSGVFGGSSASTVGTAGSFGTASTLGSCYSTASCAATAGSAGTAGGGG